MSEQPVTERYYQIIWIRDDKRTRGVACPGPLTHAEACTCLRKTTAHRLVRLMLEEMDLAGKGAP